MFDPNFILLYVNDPAESAAFYADLLGKTPVEASPTFALFALDSGVMLGLWSRHTVEPSPSAMPGSSEIAFSLASVELVRAAYDDWLRRGMTILQEPTDMDFGTTFVALDPNGHRLRVFTPTTATH